MEDLLAPPVVATPRASRLALPANPWVAMLVGALGGALWGVVARVWMRVISAEHEFTWNGTLRIIAIFAIFGLGQTIAAIARRSGWRRNRQIAVRIVSVAATIPMGLAAGGPMLPALVLAAVAVGRTNWHGGVRLAVAALAAVPPFLILGQLIDDLPLWRALVGWALMFAVYAPLVLALAGALRPFGARAVAVEPD